jgi:hypothetical protein
MSSASLRGYARVDWFTPDGLASWGDGRVFLIGTEGTLELRKNLDMAGRAGGNHMFVVNREATRHVDCSDEPVTYFGDFLMDVRDRTQRAMAQQDVFAVCGLTLRLQADASRFTALRPV